MNVLFVYTLRFKIHLKRVIYALPLPLQKASLSRALLRAMNDVYAFSQSKNSEITFRYTF